MQNKFLIQLKTIIKHAIIWLVFSVIVVVLDKSGRIRSDTVVPEFTAKPLLKYFDASNYMKAAIIFLVAAVFFFILLRFRILSKIARKVVHSRLDALLNLLYSAAMAFFSFGGLSYFLTFMAPAPGFFSVGLMLTVSALSLSYSLRTNLAVGAKYIQSQRR